MFDVRGNETTNKAKMVQKLTTYRMVRLENLIFVDETGCNTSKQQYGLVGGQLHVLTVEKTKEFGICGATTDIHFSILCFTDRLGHQILAAIILKSSKEINGIPLSYKLGIDSR
jgi:hypothetical protein